jgi:hypothetical protein
MFQIADYQRRFSRFLAPSGLSGIVSRGLFRCKLNLLFVSFLSFFDTLFLFYLCRNALCKSVISSFWKAVGSSLAALVVKAWRCHKNESYMALRTPVGQRHDTLLPTQLPLSHKQSKAAHRPLHFLPAAARQCEDPPYPILCAATLLPTSAQLPRRPPPLPPALKLRPLSPAVQIAPEEDYCCWRRESAGPWPECPS